MEIGQPVTHEEIIRSAYDRHQWSRFLSPEFVGGPVNYDKVRDSQGSGMGTELAISTHMHLVGIASALRGLAKQMDYTILSNAVQVEKMSLFAGRLGATGFQDESKKLVARVMAAHNLRTGRVLPGIPFTSRDDIEGIFSVAEHVQKISTVLLAHVPWCRNNFAYQVTSMPLDLFTVPHLYIISPFSQVRDLLFDPEYLRNVYWGRSSRDK